VREPGKPFWDFIVKDNERRERRDQIQKQLENASEEENKNLQKELEELSQTDIIEMPQKVQEDKLHHVIICGPTGCGKTYAARQLSKTHKRCIVNMSELLEWNQNARTKAYDLAEEALAKNQKVLSEIMLERDTLIKKAGKKGAQVE
jgi:DNA-binding NtrC family response regulator